MQNMQKVQENLQKAYQEVAEKGAEKIVLGKAGGDLVTAKVNLKLELVGLDLHPSLYEETSEVIGELILGAVNQALEVAKKSMKQEMMEAAKNAGFPEKGKEFGF